MNLPKFSTMTGSQEELLKKYNEMRSVGPLTIESVMLTANFWASQNLPPIPDVWTPDSLSDSTTDSKAESSASSELQDPVKDTCDVSESLPCLRDISGELLQ